MSHTKLIVILVGLPARGKSFISKKLNRYSTWVGHCYTVLYRRSFNFLDMVADILDNVHDTVRYAAFELTFESRDSFVPVTV